MASLFWQPMLDMQEYKSMDLSNQYSKQTLPYRVQQSESEAQLKKAQATEATNKAEGYAAVRDAINEAAKDHDVTPGESLEIAAKTLAKMGRVNDAATILDKAELAQSRQSRQEMLAAQTELQKIRVRQAQISEIESSLENVKDQPSLDRAIQQYEATYKEPIPEQYKTYSPEMIDQLKRSVTSAKDRAMQDWRNAETARKEAADRAKEREAASRDSIARTTNEIRRRKIEIEEQREQRLRKEGADKGNKGAVVPPTVLVKQATNIISQRFPDLAVENSDEMAYNVAAKAQLMMKRNPGLDSTSALYRAVQEEASSVSSSVKGGINIGSFNVGGKRQSKYTGHASSRSEPFPAPKSQSELTAGEWYSTPKGSLYWDGKKFQTEAPSNKSGGRPTMDESDDVEDDDE